METIDKRRIKKITINFPDIMSSNAEEEIAKEYFNILNLEDQIYKVRDNLRILEEELEKAKQDFNSKKNLFDIEFETTTVKEIRGECNLGINNSADARNKSYGSK